MRAKIIKIKHIIIAILTIATANAPSVASAADQEEVTLKDGRKLVGIYDASAGTITVSAGAGNGVVYVKPEQVVKRGPAPVAVAPAASATKTVKIYDRVKAIERELDDKEDQLDKLNADIAAYSKQQPRKAEMTMAERKAYEDDEKRRSALRASSQRRVDSVRQEISDLRIRLTVAKSAASASSAAMRNSDIIKAMDMDGAINNYRDLNNRMEEMKKEERAISEEMYKISSAYNIKAISMLNPTVVDIDYSQKPGESQDAQRERTNALNQYNQACANVVNIQRRLSSGAVKNDEIVHALSELRRFDAIYLQSSREAIPPPIEIVLK